MSKGHISYPRELYEHSAWLHYPLRYRAVLDYILLKCVWSPYEYNIAGKTFILQPGQMMTTKNRFVEDFNNTVKFKEDQINGTTLLRIWSCLTRDQMLDHQTVQHAGHKETLLTIKHSMFYGSTFNLNGPANGPANGPNSDQLRTNIKRTTEEREEKKEQQQQAAPAAAVFSCFAKIPNSQVSQVEKIKICASYAEPIVNDAVASVTQEGFIPQDSLLKSLRAACKDQWKPTATKQDNIAINRTQAQHLKAKYNGLYTIEVNCKELEIIKGVNGISEVLAYDISPENFKNKIEYLYKH